MGLTVAWTNTGTRSTADAGACFGHRHHLTLDLTVIVVVITSAVEFDPLAFVGKPLQLHDVPATNLEAASATDAGSVVDRNEKFRLPVAAAAGRAHAFAICFISARLFSSVANAS